MDSRGLRAEYLTMISLICGRSRSGKTTYAKQFDKVLHLDAFGIMPKNYDKVLKIVADIDDGLVVDGVYDTSELRTDLLKAYKGGGRKVCIWLDTPLDVIESRFVVIPSKHPYPFEPPTLDEGWDEIIIIRGNDEQRNNRQTED